MTKTFLNEPLLHFLFLGALLFVAFNLRNPDASTSSQDIVVDRERISAIQEQFSARWKRQPSSTELTGLIDEYILTEAYSREAIKLGFDKNDPVIKRRLRQIMEMMSGDITTVLEPDDDTLQRYLENHAETFQKEPTYTFSQIYINPNKHSVNLSTFLTNSQNSLVKGKEVTPDSTLLPDAIHDVPASRIDRQFGIGFSVQLDDLPLGQWSSPITSGLGLHFIKLTERKPAEKATLAEVRERVVREYVYQRRREMETKQRELLISNYDVSIELAFEKDIIDK